MIEIGEQPLPLGIARQPLDADRIHVAARPGAPDSETPAVAHLPRPVDGHRTAKRAITMVYMRGFLDGAEASQSLIEQAVKLIGEANEAVESEEGRDGPDADKGAD